jgi:hypothetical protein
VIFLAMHKQLDKRKFFDLILEFFAAKNILLMGTDALPTHLSKIRDKTERFANISITEDIENSPSPPVCKVYIQKIVVRTKT